MALNEWFAKAATKTSKIAGHPVAFIGCVLIVLLWIVTGPIFSFSDTWQLLINTGTTIVTFLMVFLIQNKQERDGSAIQAKLDELIRAHAEAKNIYIGIEDLTDEEIKSFKDRCRKEKP